MPWPNLFVVGAAKSGTTSLWRYLGAHPEIFMSSKKEPHFFSDGAAGTHPVVVERDYLALFDSAGQRHVVGEASTSYLWHETAAGAIARRVPDARIVVCLREPVARAYSSYWMWRRWGMDTRSFEDVVHAELEAGLTTDGRPSRNLGRSFYAAALRRYRDRFERVHVLFFEELVSRHEESLRDLFAFAGVDTAPAARIRPRRHNGHRVARSRLLAPLLATEAARVAGSGLPFAVRQLAWKTDARPRPDPGTAALLERLFRDDVREVEALLGRPVPWG